MLELQSQFVPDTTNSVGKLITYLVEENVKAYNAKSIDIPLFRYLSNQELEDGAYTGKIGFGDRKNENIQDEASAVNNALQSFSDGIYRVLINGTEITSEADPNTPFPLKEGDTITFIRLVMLAGRRW